MENKFSVEQFIEFLELFVHENTNPLGVKLFYDLIDIEGYSQNKDITEISSYYGGMPFATLGEKSVRQLRETFRYVMDHYSEAREKGKILRRNLVDNFTWDHLTDKIYDRLKELQ